MAYTLRTDKTWPETYGELETTFQKWGVRDWEVRSLGKAFRGYGAQSVEDRTVSIRWTTREGQPMRLEMSDQGRAVDNLRVLYLAIEAMRLNEARGIGRVMQEAYLQLAAPATSRDPYEVLGIRPDAPLAVAEGAYRALAKTLHPDAGGSDEAMRELNAAWERVKAGER